MRDDLADQASALYRRGDRARPGANIYAAMNILMLPKHTLFICDTHVNLDPSAEQVAEMAILAADEMRRFGLTPKVALLSHSNFGSHSDASARKMSHARELLAVSRRIWKSMERCTGMPRCRKAYVRRLFRIHR